jgi:hypothetical protein
VYELNSVCSKKSPLKGSCSGGHKSLLSQMVGDFLRVQQASTSLVKSVKEAIIIIITIIINYFFLSLGIVTDT